MAIAIMVGLSAGYVARPTSLDIRGYGEAHNGRKEFERSMVEERAGRRRFKDLVVHKQPVTNPDGGTRAVWVVSGLYCPPESHDGKWVWRESFYVFQDVYKPAVGLNELIGGANRDAVAKFQAIAQPSVVDFLQLLSETRGVTFFHAWWRTYAFRIWFLGSIVVIGIVWPTAIDLVVYGRLIRPRERAVHLPPSPSVVPAKAQVSAQDMKHLQELDAALEEGLRASGAPAGEAPVAAPVAAPVRKLANAPQAATVAAGAEDHRVFGAKPDDFYPTEKSKAAGKQGSSK
jgi:hypothetical protein